MEKEKQLTEKELDEVLKQIQKNFGKGAIMKLGDRPTVDVDVIPSGSLLLDEALGLPRHVPATGFAAFADPMLLSQVFQNRGRGRQGQQSDPRPRRRNVLRQTHSGSIACGSMRHLPDATPDPACIRLAQTVPDSASSSPYLAGNAAQSKSRHP